MRGEEKPIDLKWSAWIKRTTVYGRTSESGRVMESENSVEVFPLLNAHHFFKKILGVKKPPYGIFSSPPIDCTGFQIQGIARTTIPILHKRVNTRIAAIISLLFSWGRSRQE